MWCRSHRGVPLVTDFVLRVRVKRRRERIQAAMETSCRGCRERRETAKPAALPRWQVISLDEEARLVRPSVLRSEAAVRREVHPEAPAVHGAPANQAGKCFSASRCLKPGEGTASGEAEFN